MPTAPIHAGPLVALPAEVLHHIFEWLAPADLFVLPRVCKALSLYVAGNRKLYRDVYLNTLDIPRKLDLDWEKEIRDLVHLEAICNRKETAQKEPELDLAYTVVNRLLKNATPSGAATNCSCTQLASRNTDILQRLFRDSTTREAFLQHSSLFERVRRDPRNCNGTATSRSSPEPHDHRQQQQSAKLHCLYGKAILNAGRSLRSTRTYPFACSKVYDMRQYSMASHWGPFMNDGSTRVDWEKVEAILIIIGSNVRDNNLTTGIFRDIFDDPFSGAWPKSYMPLQRDISSLDARDPYGVTGEWDRIVCFIDINQLVSYNADDFDLLGPETPRPPLDTREVLRFIRMRLKVTKITDPRPQDGQGLPVVHFEGESQSLDNSMDDNANSLIRGHVRLTPEGEVRWTTISVFHGEDRWRSEGVQIGGVGSARGVFGNWFDSGHNPHGPAGPTAFWKSAPSGLSKGTLLPYPTLFDFGVDLEDSASDFSDGDDEDAIELIEELNGAHGVPGLPGLLHATEHDVVGITTHHHLDHPDADVGETAWVNM